MKSYFKLFIGAFCQWGLATAFTRFAVIDGNVSVFITVFLGQSLWWINIQQTTRDGSISKWFTWCLGAASGAVLGKILS